LEASVVDVVAVGNAVAVRARMTEPADDFPMRRLLNAGRALMGEFDTETILRRLLESACEITGARYAALGVLNERRTGFERFLAAGIDDETHRAIGDPPQGRGVLGLLIEEPCPVRLRDIASHSRSYGFPTGHPAMRSFLGVPIMVRGKAWGNLYLTEKAGGEFTEIDVEDVTTLAGWAAIAIDNARQYETGERQRQELERALRGLRANRDVALAVGSDASLDHVLELVAKHGRALVNARSLLIMLHQGDELVVAAGAGDVENARRARLALSASRLGEILERGEPERLVGVAARLPFAPHELGVGDLHAVLVVPMLYRGRAVGLLAAFDHGEGRDVFSEDDEDVLRTFATSAATRVALMQSVEVERLRSSMAAAEAERGRWARELHDETLQSLAHVGPKLRLSEPRLTANVERPWWFAVAHALLSPPHRCPLRALRAPGPCCSGSPGRRARSAYPTAESPAGHGGRGARTAEGSWWVPHRSFGARGWLYAGTRAAGPGPVPRL
jgi:GAF domain-containing protein